MTVWDRDIGARDHAQPERMPLGWVLWAVLPGAGLFLVVCALGFWSTTLEDAQITFRYARRLAEGYPFGSWNRQGPPVEGVTTFLWPWVLAPFGPGANAIATAAKLLGLASQVGLVTLFLTVAAQARRDRLVMDLPFGETRIVAFAALGSALAVAVYAPFTWYAVSGMETAAFSLLMALVVFLPLLTQSVPVLTLVAMAIVLMRPEGILVALATPAVYWALGRDRRFLVLLGIALATFAALTLWRLSVFGHPMPNTYYAKSAGSPGGLHLDSGIAYVTAGLSFLGALTLPILGLIAVRFFRKDLPPSGIAFLILASVAYLAVIAKAGGDPVFAFPYFRHVTVLVPLLAFAAFALVAALGPRIRLWLASAMLVALATLPLMLLPKFHPSLWADLTGGFDHDHDWDELGTTRYLRSIATPDTVIATGLAGQIPFRVDAIHIDILGLNDAEIAHHGSFDPHGATDSKTDMARVLARQPDIIEAYLPAALSSDLAGITSAIRKRRTKMLLELFLHPDFERDYVELAAQPRGPGDRLLLARRDYALAHDLPTGPVSLYVTAASNLAEEPVIRFRYPGVVR
ncbi:MAG: hypothetical protein AAFR35_07400 [Pseudomonadota bacterium]